MKKSSLTALCICIITFINSVSSAQTDTLRVMAYNVLGYGEYNGTLPPCQGPNSIYNAYLETIVQYANPDIIGLEKMASLQTIPGIYNYTGSVGFQDSILQYALNAAYPGRFNYCMNTNFSGSNTECLVFYNQQKLGYLGITCSYNSGAGNEDFDTYKFFYLDPNLAATHDTTYLYVTDNHDISGNGNQSERGAQITAEMADVKNHFSHLANMINMGDFNLRNTSEPVYQTLTNPADTNFRYYDPPFYPDGVFSYPPTASSGDWDSNPAAYSSFLTTSTRQSGSVPNSCGTSGGGKDWYDHIFLSPWIINGANYISYIPHSCHVLGNDGHRLGISVNDPPANTAVPSAIANALFQMSNKYPILVDLLLSPNTTGTSLPDPEILPSTVVNHSMITEYISVANPVGSQIVLNYTSGLIGQTVSVECVDMLGRNRLNIKLVIENGSMQIPCNLEPGVYALRVVNGAQIICQAIITKY
jgi:hypothetical protein